jgi:predicted RNA-binding protein with PUA-like domain
MRAEAALADMQVLRRCNRLSITPVTPDQWRAMLRLTSR